MNAEAFWRVIGEYNSSTQCSRAALLALLAVGLLLTVIYKKSRPLKLVLGVLNLFIGIGFFLRFGTEPIQRYFALPLYVGIGALFLYEAYRSGDEPMEKPSSAAWGLMVLYVLYPVVSVLLGARFPQMVTHIMPCPVVTVSIALYSCCGRKNLPLLVLLTIWGLTGVKADIFAAYEDNILLLAGIYGVYLTVREIKRRTGERKREKEKTE